MKKVREITNILDKIYNLYPNTKIELNYKTPFQLLISVILSAQNTDKQVNKVTEAFFEIIKNPEDILNLKITEIEKYLKSLNYYKHKTKYIKLSGEKLYKEFNSTIPNDLIKIQTLPGVGIKSAKVILSTLYNLSYVGVDTHVHRVLNRIGIVKTKSPKITDSIIEKVFTAQQKKKMHHSLVLFGRYNCTARKPKCDNCAVGDWCNFKHY